MPAPFIGNGAGNFMIRTGSFSAASRKGASAAASGRSFCDTIQDCSAADHRAIWGHLADRFRLHQQRCRSAQGSFDEGQRGAEAAAAKADQDAILWRSEVPDVSGMMPGFADRNRGSSCVQFDRDNRVGRVVRMTEPAKQRHPHSIRHTRLRWRCAGVGRLT